MIRNVDLKDAKAITDIYNYYIESTIVTFEESKVCENEMIERIKSHNPNLPWIVYEENKQIYGYAYVSEWKSRCAYKYSVESSIYLNHTKLGKGIGTKLYKKLLSQVMKKNIHIIIAGISLPNEASVKLHEKLGFQNVGQFKEVGYKFEKWIDVGYWQLKVN